MSAPRLRRATVGALLAGVAVIVPAADQASASATTVSIGGPSLAMAVGDSGYLYAASGTDIVRVRLSDLAVTTSWANVGPTAFDMAIDAAGNIYTANASVNGVSRITPGGETSGTSPNYEWAPTGTDPESIAIGPDGAVFVGNYQGASVTRITPAGQSSGTSPAHVWSATGNGPSPGGLAVGPDGTVYVPLYLGSAITRISSAGVPSGSSPTYAWATTEYSPTGIALDSAGHVYTANRTSDSVTRVAPDGTATPAWATLSTGGHAEDMTIDSGGNLYVANGAANSVTKVRPDGTTQMLSSTGAQPARIAIDSSGNIYTANYSGNSITRISNGGGTPEILPAPPAIPVAPTAAPTDGDTRVTVTITPNGASSRYGAPSGYLIASVEDPSKGCSITAPATSCTVSGLTQGARYSFTARSVLNAWTTPASAPSAAVPVPTPAAPSGPAAGGSASGGATPGGSGTRPKPLGGAFRVSRTTGVGTTTGAVPPGATSIVQTARTAGSAATQGFLEMAKAKTAKGACRITSVRNKKTKKVTKRTYRCTIRLGNGTWTVTTTARGTAGVVATSTRRVAVR